MSDGDHLPPLLPDGATLIQPFSNTNPRSTSINAGGDVQQMALQLSAELQKVSNELEDKVRHLETDLTALQQELRPALQDIERQQVLTTKQLEDLRQKAQDLNLQELTPLQHKFSQMNSRFDRFMRVEIETKLKPIQDELRQTKSRVDNATRSTDEDIRKLKSDITSLSKRYGDLNSNAVRERENFNSKISEFEPNLQNLQLQIEEFSARLNIGAESETTLSAQLEGQLRELDKLIETLQNEVIPERLQINSEELMAKLQAFSELGDGLISNTRTSLATLASVNDVDTQKLGQAEHSLESLTAKSNDLRAKLDRLKADADLQLPALEERLRTAREELVAEADKARKGLRQRQEERKTEADDVAKSLREEAQGNVVAAREEIKAAADENLRNLTEQFAVLSRMNDNVKGQGNLMMRLTQAEKRVGWLVTEIENYDKVRDEVRRKCGAPNQIRERIQRVQERLKDADTRLKNKGL
jgi:DNA repair exonuclease SbcCD ATPase subunit